MSASGSGGGPLGVGPGLAIDGELREAAEYGDARAVKALLAQNADPHACDMLGYTALHRAAHCGRVFALQALLDANAAVNTTTVFGTTPLHAAAAEAHLDVVEILMGAGADVSVRTAEGATARHLASGKNRELGYERCNGAGLRVASLLGWGGHEADDRLLAACQHASVEEARAALDAGADPDAIIGILQLQLKAKAAEPACDLASDSEGDSPPQPAESPSEDVALPENAGFTALHVAAKAGSKPVIDLLLEAKANAGAVAAVEGKAKTAADLAESVDPAIAALLRDAEPEEQ
mmetsp:Transcript_88786/g.203082  ORF Transcript_88786/g.203082 Transcript_88786/m.203082 type:complete len:293 (+) Transcript_88786:54-932(+)